MPGNGQPIVLLADRQTTGGYPKIATVISADLPALAGCRSARELRFEAVTVEEAEAARREHLAELAAMKDRSFRSPSGTDVAPRSARLQSRSAAFVDAAA